MIHSVLTLLAAAAFAGAAPKAPERPPEETLRVMLSDLRKEHSWEDRKAIMGGGAEELRDAVTSGAGEAKKQLADRLPGMSKDPFGVCRDLAGCREAPQSLHVEDEALIDDAFLALARPWFKLQKARGKSVSVSVDPGVGVRLALEDLPRRPAVTLQASPTPTGGFDVSLEDGPEAAQAFAAERAALLEASPSPAR